MRRKLLVVLALLALLAADGLAQGTRRRAPRTDRPLGVDVGDPAPELVVTDPQGKAVPLASLWADRPLVLILGSYSSPEFRGTAPAILQMVVQNADSAAFAVLYTAEAHPSGGGGPYPPSPQAAEANREAGVEIAAHADLTARQAAAGRAQQVFDLRTPVALVVDGMDDAGWQAFGRSPNPAILIDRGFVVHWQAQFEPEGMQSALDLVLRARAMAEPSEAPATRPEGR